ncbi:MAG: cyclase [Anaerolineae bacterium]|nr:cyclase [Anaerolineae bacterium]
MNIRAEVKKLLQEIGPGRMMSTAYDTAWVARLVELGEPMGEQALEWLREHQLPDGSWGAYAPRYYHDRMISTLAAMTALGRYGTDKDKPRIERARMGLDIAARGLRADPVGETIGFELIVPTLLDEAHELGILQRTANGSVDQFIGSGKSALDELASDYDYRRRDDFLGRLSAQRKAKLKALPDGKINRHVTLAFSAEMVGTDNISLLDIENLQEPNGSVGHSPSATAHYALYASPGDLAALSYLGDVVKVQNGGGAAPNVAPFDVFERAWTLWNLSLCGDLEPEILELCQPHLDFLDEAWIPGCGMGFAAEYTPKDCDGTSVTFDVLDRYGRKIEQDTLFVYEEASYFRCFPFEANPSISVNIHALSALRQAGFEADYPSVEKIKGFLTKSRYLRSFWLDKWHVSPYYPTTHLLIIANQYIQELIPDTLQWILDTQNFDGSWGYYGATAEETAYCLQALLVLKQSGVSIPTDVLKNGIDWLVAHKDAPYPPLWIGKCLYSPTLVVRSVILSAMSLALQGNIL